MISLVLESKNTKLIKTENRLVMGEVGAWDMGDSGQRVQTSS